MVSNIRNVQRLLDLASTAPGVTRNIFTTPYLDADSAALVKRELHKHGNVASIVEVGAGQTWRQKSVVPRVLSPKRIRRSNVPLLIQMLGVSESRRKSADPESCFLSGKRLLSKTPHRKRQVTGAPQSRQRSQELSRLELPVRTQRNQSRDR